LTKEINEVKEFIERQQARGGGDTPEDIPGGLKAALDMKWTASAKVIVLVTDAPCHGSKYHDLPPEEDTQGRASDPNIEEQMREIARRGIAFAMIDIRPQTTRKMVPLLRVAYESVAKATRVGLDKKKTIGITNLATFHVVPFEDKASSEAQKDSSAMSLLIDTMVQAASTQLETSVTMSFQAMMCNNDRSNGSEVTKTAAAHGVSDERVEAVTTTLASSSRPLNWDVLDCMHSENAMRYTYWFNIEGVNPADWSADPSKYLIQHQQRTTVRVMRSFFNQGQMRTAHGLLDETINQRLVAKVYKNTADCKLESYQLDAKVQTIAKALAKEFSKHPKSHAAIDFISVSFYELLDRPQSDRFKYFAAEPYMTGSYVKYNNNGGWTMAASTTGMPLNSTQQEFGKIAEAFSHFTWALTGGMMHCVDLQGVDNILTDPQIHCKLSGAETGIQCFGKGDCGQIGTALFFKSHVCNEHCLSLCLTPLNNAQLIPSAAFVSPVTSEEVRLCCDLYCGTVFTTSHVKYVQDLGTNREIYCPPCTEAYNAESATGTCNTCGHAFPFRPFWYRMKGKEAPQECPKHRKKQNK
jgi:hypothetical protein